MDRVRNAPPQREEVGALSMVELIARYRLGVENFDRRVFELTDAQLDTPFRPESGVGLWPARVLLGHLADAEVPSVYRMRRVVAEERPVLEAWDEQAFIDAGMYGGVEGGAKSPIGGFIATIHTLRQWSGEWLVTLADAAWSRSGLHTQAGEQSLRDLVDKAVWHLEHHAWYLNQKVALFLGNPRW